jgi:hypothetical protein
LFTENTEFDGSKSNGSKSRSVGDKVDHLTGTVRMGDEEFEGSDSTIDPRMGLLNFKFQGQNIKKLTDSKFNTNSY